jgi:hypothetical protein
LADADGAVEPLAAGAVDGDAAVVAEGDGLAAVPHAANAMAADAARARIGLVFIASSP